VKLLSSRFPESQRRCRGSQGAANGDCRVRSDRTASKSSLMKNPRFLLAFALLSLFLFPGNSLAQAPQVDLIRIQDDTINPITAEYIVDAIAQAEKNGSEILIIELDTPGGLLSSTRIIVKSILASKVPVVVYVAPSGARAGSAGVFITYAGHVAAMAPSTNIGAAHPVSLGGGRRSLWDSLRDLIDHFVSRKEDGKEKKVTEEKEASPMESKVLQDTVAFIKALAQERGRNVHWAEQSVTQSKSITETEALKMDVIDLIAADPEDLLRQLDGRTVSLPDGEKTLKTKQADIHAVEMNFRQRFLNVLANPNFAYILLMLGFYGLLFEVTHPGIGVPGVLGAIFIILAFFSLQILPTNYAGLALIALALVLFVAEAFIPGLGLPTLGGIVCMFLGSMLLFDSPYEVMRVSWTLILSRCARRSSSSI